MTQKLAVFFPGIGYHNDKPLLYYSQKLAKEFGFECIKVNYNGFASGIKSNKEKMKEALEIAYSQSMNQEIFADDTIFYGGALNQNGASPEVLLKFNLNLRVNQLQVMVMLLNAVIIS